MRIARSLPMLTCVGVTHALHGPSLLLPSQALTAAIASSHEPFRRASACDPQEFSLPAATTRTETREHRMRVDEIRVDEARVVQEADGLRLVFPVTHGQTQTNVWFTVRNADAAPSGNAALAIALVPAMRAARSLVLADSLSPRLFASQAAIQKLFQDWDNRFNVVGITAPPGETPQASTGGTGLFFTGGVDSFFSLLMHREEITHLIFVRRIRYQA